MTLEAIKYKRGDLQILDQLQLPHSTVYEQIKTSEDAWEAIRSMRVRGAPAIAIVAALGLAVELYNDGPSNDRVDFIYKKLDYLNTSRPTAVNLSGAVKQLKDGTKNCTDTDAIDTYVTAAEKMLSKDVQDNKAIGEFGAQWILTNTNSDKPMSILTHCNTGSLATAGYGTALGVIRSVYAKGRLQRAYCTETRPYNQGSRLTAYELVHDKIPSTLITDSMASALLSVKGKDENIVAIVVGADRVAANGDTANKIGTYALAITAKHHGVKFLVAAPRTTIDMATENGMVIEIEQRRSTEMTSIRGFKLNGSCVDLKQPPETISIAADNIDVWNPAFDITPAALIDAIITEVGVAEKDSEGHFNLKLLMS